MEVDSATERSSIPPYEDCRRQVRQILQSVSFRNTPALQQLLQFLTARVLEGGSGESLKEYTIGVEAFGRPQDFDPKTDTIVRVQIHRLRQKLREYYDSDGKRDSIIVAIPKGHYLPSFEARVGAESQTDRGLSANTSDGSGLLFASAHTDPAGRRPDAEPEASTHDLPSSFGNWIKLASAASLLIAVFVLGLWIGARKQTANRTHQPFDPDVVAFWASFVGDDPNPVIAFPDAVFLLDNSNDLLSFRQGASDDRGSRVDSHLARQGAYNPSLVAGAGALYYENGYTGAGELQGIAMLAGLFGQMGIHPLIKPSRDITPIDLRQHSVILLGSSFQNVAVARLMNSGDFRFFNPDSPQEPWHGEIANTHPQGKEAATYHTERDPETLVLRADYGIVSVQSGVVPGRHIAILGGLDTTGTEGATLFATSRSGVEEMRKALGGSLTASGEIPQFQAVVQIRLEKGFEVLGSSLVALHRIVQPGEKTN